MYTALLMEQPTRHLGEKEVASGLLAAKLEQSVVLDGLHGTGF